MSTEYSQLKDMTEKRLGVTLCDHSFQEVLTAGRRKLDWIISREGDADGMRREDWYLVQLIYEYMQGCMLSEYCRLMNEVQKEKAPRLPASAPNQIILPIV